MPLNKEQKKKIIEKIKESIDKQKIAVFVAIAGLKAKDAFNLRNRLKESDCMLNVVKKTLLKIASKDKKFPVEADKIAGEIALIFGFKDELSAPKIARKFSKENENLKILGGIFEGQFIEKEKVLALAEIPSREELLAKMLGSMQAPIANFASVLNGNIKGLIYLLTKIKA